MRFFGDIGFGEAVEKKPGIWEDRITKKKYYGEVLQNTQQSSNSGSVLTENTFQTTLSIVADAYALENYMSIKFVRWAGSYWTVNSVQPRRPRLLLTLGEVYNGPTG